LRAQNETLGMRGRIKLGSENLGKKTQDLRKRLLDILAIKMSKKKPRKRIEVKGHYMQVRQRSTKKGKKGTIMGKWKPEKKPAKKKN